MEHGTRGIEHRAKSEMVNRVKKISEDQKRLVTDDEFKKIYWEVMGVKV